MFSLTHFNCLAKNCKYFIPHDLIYFPGNDLSILGKRGNNSPVTAGIHLCLS